VFCWGIQAFWDVTPRRHDKNPRKFEYSSNKPFKNLKTTVISQNSIHKEVSSETLLPLKILKKIIYSA
jgi:hypothetical protein